MENAIIQRAGVASALAGLLALAGCSNDSEPEEVSVAGASASITDQSKSLLAHVPAKSPYAFAMLSPLPDDAAEKLEITLDGQLKAYKKMLARAMDEISESERQEEPLMFATLAALQERMSLDGLESIGYDLQSVNAVYGVGLLPVARLTLSDVAGFESFIAEIEERAGESFERHEAGGISYRSVFVDPMSVAFTTAPGHLVVALMPNEMSDSMKATVLGATPPEVSMLEDNEFARLNAEYDWRPFGSGYFDIVSIADAFLRDDNDAMTDALFEAMDIESGDISAECSTELREMAAVMPKIVSGIKRYDGEHLTSQTIVRLRDDIASGLTDLAVPIPGMTDTTAGLFSMGVSFKLLAMKQFASTQVQAIQNDPYQCEWFAEMNDVEEVAAQLQQPLPPFVSVFKGFRFIIDEFEMTDNQSQPDMKGRALIAMDNPQMLLGMAQMMSPELAALEIQANGEAVALPMDSLPAGSPQPYLAMTDAGIAIGVGEENGGDLQNLLNAPTDDAGKIPVMTFTYDMEAFGDLMGGLAGLESAFASDEGSDEQQELEEIQELMRNQVFDRVSALFYFTDQGMEILYEGDFK